MVCHWDFSIRTLSPEITRRAYLYLPEAYHREQEARFPVLYLFDGQMAFEDSSHSMHMEEDLDRLQVPLIVCGMSSNTVGNARLSEYAPFSLKQERFGALDGLGPETMRWLCGTFKPMIDATVRTLPDRAHTFIGGMSMGGLMSLYGCLHFNDIFSKGVSLSPSLWIHPEKSRRMIRTASPAPDTVLYLDYGEREMANHPENRAVLAYASSALFKKDINLTFRIIPGGTHQEASWKKQIPLFLHCLGL